MLKVHEIYPKVTQQVSTVLDLLESAPCLAWAEDPFLTIPPLQGDVDGAACWPPQTFCIENDLAFGGSFC